MITDHGKQLSLVVLLGKGEGKGYDETTMQLMINLNHLYAPFSSSIFTIASLPMQDAASSASLY